MVKTKKAHGKGSIIPEQYDYVGSYYLGHVEEVADIIEQIHYDDVDFGIQAIQTKLDQLGAVDLGVMRYGVRGGNCTACGARFLYGSVWLHREKLEAIHLGHDCAGKYELLKAHPEAALDRDRLEQRTAAYRLKLANDKRETDFCALHDGLAPALQYDHGIISDIRNKLRRFGSISDKQIALVHKIIRDQEERKNRPEEQKVPVPIEAARQLIEGEIVSLKLFQGDFGSSMKMTVKVKTEQGSWLCWGTAGGCFKIDYTWPDGRHLYRSPKKGDVVRFMAKLQPGNEPHFALFKRPTQAEYVAMSIRKEER